MKPRVVYDCMIFLQGAAFPRGPAGACLRLVDEGRVTLCLSGAILNEIRDVLSRPTTLRKFPQLSPEWVVTFVESVESKGLLLPEPPRVLILDRDPKDEPYLNLSLAAGANYLVTRDRDLLDLMSDDEFQRRGPPFVVLEPAAFLGAIATAQSRELDASPESENPPESESNEGRDGSEPAKNSD
jgi:uncharacterized protein